MNSKFAKLFSNSILIHFVVAVVFVGLALVVTLLIWAFIQPLGSPLFLVAIVLSAWWGGLRAGIFATIFSGIILDFYFISPQYQFAGNMDDIFRLIFFGAEGFVLSWLIDTRRIAAEEIENSREQLRALSLHQQNLREAEQKRIALEVHDELGQSLTGIKLGVHWLNRQINEANGNSSKTSVTEKLNDLMRMIDSTILSVRRIATELRPAVLDDFGLLAAIEWQASEFEKKTEIPCLLKSNVENLDLNSESTIAVFRIFQEALTNIIRHAEASTVKVNFESSDEEIVMRVEDNGKGINLNNMQNRTSLGILGMQERARLIGAGLKIFEGKKGGTTVELIIPNTETLRNSSLN